MRLGLIVLSLLVALPGATRAEVPAAIAAPGETTVATWHAEGAQVYECKAGGDGKLVASIFCAMNGDALYVGRLAVAPAYRRRGVASALVDAAKAEARRLGAKRITLGARIALPGNVALFRRHGFMIVRETCHPGFTTPTSYDMELALA